MPLVVETTGETTGETSAPLPPELVPTGEQLEEPCCSSCALGEACEGEAARPYLVIAAGGAMLAGGAALGAHIAGTDHRVLGAAGGAGLVAAAQQGVMAAGTSHLRGVGDPAAKLLALAQGGIGGAAAIGAAVAPKRRALGAFLGGAVATAVLAAVVGRRPIDVGES